MDTTKVKTLLKIKELIEQKTDHLSNLRKLDEKNIKSVAFMVIFNPGRTEYISAYDTAISDLKNHLTGLVQTCDEEISALMEEYLDV